MPVTCARVLCELTYREMTVFSCCWKSVPGVDVIHRVIKENTPPSPERAAISMTLALWP